MYSYKTWRLIKKGYFFISGNDNYNSPLKLFTPCLQTGYYGGLVINIFIKLGIKPDSKKAYVLDCFNEKIITNYFQYIKAVKSYVRPQLLEHVSSPTHYCHERYYPKKSTKGVE